MIITDRIYGELQIEDGLIADLVRSTPMERLKHISQDGATHFIVPSFDVTRCEHSVGAWYLAKRFGRPIEEQVACLLHDVPHTAFSHVVDHVMDDRNQEYHDRFLKQVVLASDIPDICKRYDIDIQKVLAKENYHLLDNHTPELSFDRWDYFMRDGFMVGVFPQESIDLILNSAKLHDGKFYFEDVHVAAMFCVLSITVCELIYTGATSYGSYCLLARALREALDTAVITESDLFTTDQIVYNKLVSANNSQISEYLDRLKPGREFMLATKEDAEFYGHNKTRFIDPLVRQGERFIPVSGLVIGLQDRIERFRAESLHTGVTQIH